MKTSALRAATAVALAAPLLLVTAVPASAAWHNGGSTYQQYTCENSRKINHPTQLTLPCHSYLAKDPNSSSKFARTFWTYDYWLPY